MTAALCCAAEQKHTRKTQETYRGSKMAGPGDDIIIAVAGNQLMDGEGGIDLLDMQNAGAGGSFVDLGSGQAFSSATGVDTVANIENVKGSDGSDGLNGNGGSNVFVATAGDDTIDGRDGVDTFDASAATAGVTIDLAEGEASGTAIPLTNSVGSGAFTADLTSIENAVGGSGGDTFTGSTADKRFTGNGGVDTVIIDEAILTAPCERRRVRRRRVGRSVGRRRTTHSSASRKSRQRTATSCWSAMAATRRSRKPSTPRTMATPSS